MNEPPRVTVAVDPHPAAASRGVAARRHRDGFSQAVEYAFRPRHALFEHGELTFNAIQACVEVVHACIEFVDASAGRASIRFTPVRSRTLSPIIDVGSDRKSIARNRKALGGCVAGAASL